MESGSLVAHNMGDSEISSKMIGPTKIHRGMTVQTREGETAGHVAAVVLDRNRQEMTHVLLLEQELPEYRLIPVEHITKVDDEKVLLNILRPVVDSFLVWHRR